MFFRAPFLFALDPLVSATGVWVPGIGGLWPSIYFVIRPERKETLETFLE